MDRKTAKAIVNAIRATRPIFNELDRLSDFIADETERRAFRRGLAGLILEPSSDIIDPIVEQYPDLDPDRDEPLGPSGV